MTPDPRQPTQEAATMFRAGSAFLAGLAMRGRSALRGPDGVVGALWRSLSAFRWASLGYAGIVLGTRLHRADRPVLGIILLAVMAVWTVTMTVLVPVAENRQRLLAGAVLADVALCVGMVLGAELAGPRPNHALPMVWATSGVFAAALRWGTAGGLASGLAVTGAFFVEWGELNDTMARTAAQVLVAGTVAGYLSGTAMQAEAAFAEVMEARAADAERARLARDVHDGVLQVLALLAREAPRGLPPAEVARLAAEQESALRALLRAAGPAATAATALPSGRAPKRRLASGGRTAGQSGRAGDGGGEADLAQALLLLAHPAAEHAAVGPPGAGQPTRLPPVTVATPGVPVPLRADQAAEVVGAARAALDNVARHAGPGASAWVLLEDDGDEVVVTIRDDGVGIAPGRMETAAAEGRLGLAVSISGRVRDLGGQVTVTGRAGQGTEVELRVPR